MNSWEMCITKKNYEININEWEELSNWTVRWESNVKGEMRLKQTQGEDIKEGDFNGMKYSKKMLNVLGLKKQLLVLAVN